MTTRLKPLSLTLVTCLSLALSACYVEDPGPRQETERQYTIVDFDRLEMGSGFHINVEQGSFYSVKASGDRRNIEDLVVKTEGSTLVIKYRNFRERRHDTFIEITMPDLRAVTFSGGSESTVYGFSGEEVFDVHLSGGSVCQLDVAAHRLHAVLSGASYLKARGDAEVLDADVSGASALKAYSLPVTQADLLLSGASDGEVTVSDVLRVTATGASHLVYRGNPTLHSDVSGASSVHQE
jgi:hypothetical protein